MELNIEENRDKISVMVIYDHMTGGGLMTTTTTTTTAATTTSRSAASALMVATIEREKLAS